MIERWPVARLGSLLTLEYGKPLPERDRDAAGHPVFGSSGIIGRHSRWLVAGPGIVVGRKGTAGSVTWTEENFFPIDTTYWVRLIDPASLNLRFVSLLLEEADLPGICAQTGVPGLNRDRAYEIDVRVPPMSEQRRIVDLIGALDAQIEALEAERRGVLALRATMMCAHVADCAEFSTLGTLVEVAQGKALPRERQGLNSGPMPWFKIADMTGPGNQYGYNRADTSLTWEEIAALKGQVLPVGSVVFPRVGAAVLTEKKPGQLGVHRHQRGCAGRPQREGHLGDRRRHIDDLDLRGQWPTGEGLGGQLPRRPRYHRLVRPVELRVGGHRHRPDCRVVSVPRLPAPALSHSRAQPTPTTLIEQSRKHR